jgi:lipid A 3-O-deacylase PagL
MKRAFLAGLLGLAAVRADAEGPRWGALLLAGQSIDAEFQGHAEIAAPGLFAEKPLSAHFSLRAEIFPFLVIREGPGRLHRGDASARTATASAAGALLRYVALPSGAWRPFADAGIGPFYSYQRAVPADGTHGNYFPQAGLGVWRALPGGGRWEILLRAVHVSNGHGREPRNPGYTFWAVGMGWSPG